jgi:ribosome-binding factor A
MKQGSSSRKVNEQARQILADILLFDVSDPRLRNVTITGCEVSFDRSYCNVFYTTDPGDYEKAAEAFEKAKGRIRSLMSKRQSWRVTPELRFLRDESIDQAERIDLALKADASRNAGADADGAVSAAGEDADTADA